MHRAIAQAEIEKDKDEEDRLCLIFIARYLDGSNYEGKYTRQGEVIKAVGHGTLTKDSNRYEGEFRDGEQVRTGPIKISYSNNDVYNGHWKNG